MTIAVNGGDFRKEVLESGIPVLVDFWADWCMPCRMIAPVIDQIAKENEGRLKVCKVNVDEAQSTAAEYGVMSIPTLVIFKDGQVADKIVGAVSKEVIESKLRDNL